MKSKLVSIICKIISRPDLDVEEGDDRSNKNYILQHEKNGKNVLFVTKFLFSVLELMLFSNCWDLAPHPF